MRQLRLLLGVLLAGLLLSDPLCAYAADTARLPVAGVTVFKDGYAFVQQEGVMPVDEQGNVVLDELPEAVLGTFWSYVSQEGVALKAVVAKRMRVRVDRTALSLQELLIANPGAPCSITEEDGKTYSATLDTVPVRSSKELAQSGRPEDRERMPERGTVVMLKTDAGLKVLPLEKVRDVTFSKDPIRTQPDEEFRNRLELRLDWGGKAPSSSVKIGYMYLQKGLRWIPNYKVDLDDAGKAHLALQATLVNELIDFQTVPVNLVVGVPTIAFRDIVDPMALQSAAAQIAARTPAQPMFSNAFSNAIMSQTAAPVSATNAGGPAGNAADLGPDVANTQQREELFVFTVKDVSLKRGERMVIPVASYAAAYQDVYALDLPLSLPAEAAQSAGSDPAVRAAAQLAEPKVMHRARLTNTTDQPFTTAPALLMKQGSVMAQTMMTYTPPGAPVDLDITAAVDIQVIRKDDETKRTMNALTVRDVVYSRVDVQGSLILTSFRPTPVTVEVKRRVIGASDSIGQGGTIRNMNSLAEEAVAQPWYGHLSWVREVNGIVEFAWQVPLEPRTPAPLDHAWHYFWR